MKKSDIAVLPEYYDRYIRLVDDLPVDEAFEQSLREIDDMNWSACRSLGDRVYAPGKWTVRDVLQHLIDWERILGYRALLYLRDTGLKPESLDEDLLALSAQKAGLKSFDGLLEELRLVRGSTRSFYRELNETALQKSGVSWNSEMSVLAMAFTILGHQKHHFAILRERYLPLVGVDE